MERSNYIVIKASTNSHCDFVDFAIIDLTYQFAELLHQRLLVVEQFKTDLSFHNLTYWDGPLDYYRNTHKKLANKTILNANEDWSYIKLKKDELKVLSIQETPLEAHQLIITKHGFANYKAKSKYTNEEYWTESFSIPQILCKLSISSLASF